MLTDITHTGIWVHDLDEALSFYTTKLAFEVRHDIRQPGWSWVVVGPAGSHGAELMLNVPGPPLIAADTARRVLELVAAGVIGGGILASDDCYGDFTALKARGVEFHQEPIEREYGIDAAFRDPSGNGWRITQRH
jgi:catechol 2,3-dioxygenase-like lactoylglutathione lyase family enzyme